MWDKVVTVLDEIRPMFQADGGDIELIQVTADGIVHIRFEGTCGTCSGSIMTLKQGVERLVMEQVPEVREVVVV